MSRRPTRSLSIAALKKRDPNAVANYASVGAWDGMHVIHKMIEATGGQKDGLKAMASARALQWESPRGPVRIDPKTRHITQNVYLRQVEKRGWRAGQQGSAELRPADRLRPRQVRPRRRRERRLPLPLRSCTPCSTS